MATAWGLWGIEIGFVAQLAEQGVGLGVVAAFARFGRPALGVHQAPSPEVAATTPTRAAAQLSTSDRRNRM